MSKQARKEYTKILRKKKRKITERLKRKQWEEQKRPGNVPSHSGAVEWTDKAIALVKPHAKRVCLRGDTDFSLTGNFDRWSEQVDFVFGMDAHSGLIKRAGELPEGAWEELNRKPKYQVKTEERLKPENVIEQLKNGVNAIQLPLRDLLSNWA